MPEAPICDVTYGKHHQLQLEDSTYMLFILASAAVTWKPEKFKEEELIPET